MILSIPLLDVIGDTLGADRLHGLETIGDHVTIQLNAVPVRVPARHYPMPASIYRDSVVGVVNYIGRAL
jgi:hypothetical protein